MVPLPAAPRDMTVLLAPQDEAGAKLASTQSGRTALMQAYAIIGIGVEASSVLVAKAQKPVLARKPMWETVASLDVARLLSAAGLTGGKSEAEKASGADELPAGIHAALLKAAATNSNPQNTMALIAAAAAANQQASAQEEPPPLPPSEPAPPPPGQDPGGEPGFDAPSLPARKEDSAHNGAIPSKAAQSVSFSLSSMMRQTPAQSFAAEEAKTEHPSRNVAGMDSLRALLEANKERSYATTAAMPAPVRGSEQARGLSDGFAGAEGEIRRGEGNVTMYLGGIPRGTGEGLILVESKKFGAVVDLFYEEDAASLFDGGWALVTFATAEEAHAAVRRLKQRVSLFGATTPMEVRLGVPEDDDRVQKARQAKREAEAAGIAAADPNQAAAAADGKDDKKDKKRKRSRSKRRRRDRRRRRRSSSYSSSSSSSDRKKRPAPTPIPVEARKLSGGSAGFDAVPSLSSALGTGGAAMPSQLLEVPSGGRQVGVRGSWAEFATADGRNYYVSVVTGEKTWARPADYTNNSSARAGQVSANGIPLHHSNLFVGSIPYGCSEIMFRQMFAPFGHILSMKVVPEKRHGFVKFSSVPEAQSAIDTMNGVVINGTALSVKYASMGCH